MMLDRLESSDGPAELLAHLGVVDGSVDAVGGPTDRLGGQQCPRARQGRFPRSRQNVVVADADVLQPDTSGSPGRIQVLRHLDRHAVAATVYHQHIVTRRDQEQVAQTRAQHHAGVTVGHPVVDPYVAVQADARGHGSVDQTWQQPRLLLGGSVFGDHRRGDDGRHERPRRHRPTEFVDDDHEFGQAVSRAAVILVDVQAKPAELDDALPERRPLLLWRVQQGPRRRARLLRSQETARNLCEFAVVIGQCDTHSRAFLLDAIGRLERV